MVHGTRSLGHPRGREPWGTKELAEAAGVTDKTVRNWRSGNPDKRTVSDNIRNLERVFFGPDTARDSDWYLEERSKFKAALLTAESERDKRVTQRRVTKKAAHAVAPATTSGRDASPIAPGSPQSDVQAVHARFLVRGVPPRNPDFVGRSTDLHKIHGALRPTEPVAEIGVAAIHGLGGVGKTTLATEYAHRHAREYAGVWWAPAEDRPALFASLAQLGKAIEPNLASNIDTEAIAKETLGLVAQCHPPWLLIYDNVPSPRAISDLLPGGNSRILATTRWTDWTGYAQEVELDDWDEASAITYLIKRVRHLHPREARRLAKELGCLPLALDHAGSYLQHTGVSSTDYLSRINHVMAQTPPGAQYPRSVFATFSLAVAQAASECPEAERLLAFLSILSPERVPLQLFEPVIDDCEQRDRALATLSLVSLIKHDNFDDGGAAIIVHRLVQAVMRERLRAYSGSAAQFLRTAVETISDAFPSEPFRATAAWPYCEKLAPHAMQVMRQAEVREIEIDKILSLGYRLGRFLHGRSELKQAATVYRRAIAHSRARGGCENDLTIRMVNALSNLLRDRGSLKLAEPVARAAIALATGKYGKRHALVAEAFNSFAVLLRDIGRYGESEQAFRDAMDVGGAVFGAAALEVATYSNNLGVLFRQQSRYSEAQTRFEFSIKVGIEKLGPDSADVQTWCHNLAMTLYDLGEYEAACALIPGIMSKLKEALGERHPNYIRSRVTWAKILLAKNKAAEALIEARSAHAAYALGQKHPWTLDAAKTMVGAFVALGQVAEARQASAKYGVVFDEFAASKKGDT